MSTQSPVKEGDAASISPSSSSFALTFSIRIVSIDYYMSPPITDLDFCYSTTTLQGRRKVEQVPVIRIFGSTLAGQKACLHIHRALPYLYIPCPEDVLQNPEEGNIFVHTLSSSLEKALSTRSTPKRQHIHGCHFVRAKKLYGYHSSDDLFVKIYLYYPHEVARTATLLLDGAILNRRFQPYESHIPYLLQFLVDYNLYGMGHLHTTKFKFRPPLPDVYIPRVDSSKKHDTQAVGNSAIWLSSTVQNTLVWPDSSSGKGGLEGKTINLTNRQSVCDIEADASVDDILNEREKMYSSLSQIRSDVKMVQSLVPIWEEEYSRSGTPEAAKSPVLSRPLPEIILGRFLDGLEYDLALTELCTELEKAYPLKVSTSEGDKLLEKSIILFNGSGGAHAPRDDDKSNCPKENLMCPGDKCANNPAPCSSLSPVKKKAAPEKSIAEIYQLRSTVEISSFQTRTTEKECTVGDALGLLNWLASSQALEEFTANDELVQEAIITPLFPSKSYRETLEIAHLDYESASQQECQDILDSVLNPEGFREQASSSSHEVDPVVNLIPQLDGSFDDSGNISQKFEHSGTNTTSRRADSSAGHVGRGTTTSGSKRRRSNILWGALPFLVKEKDHEDSECPLIISSQNEEMQNDSESSSPPGSIEARCCDCLKADTGVESTAEKEGNMVGTCSVRDLMRRKRSSRMDESEADLHKSDMAALCPERFTSDREGCYLLPIEASKVESSIVHKDDDVQENGTWFPACKLDASMQGCEVLPIDACSPNQQTLLLSGQGMQSNVILNKHCHFQKEVTHEEGTDFSIGSLSFPVKGESLTPAVSTKFPAACQTRHLRTAVCSSCFRGPADEMPDISWSLMKGYDCSVESKRSRSHLKEKQSVYGDSESHQYESHSGDEHLKENLYFGTKDLTNVLAEKTYSHDVWKHVSDDNISQNVLETHFTSGLHKGNDALKHVEMTFNRMPPLRYEVQVVMPSEDSPETAGSNINDETLAFNYLSVGAYKQSINDFPPFFPRNFEDEKLCKLYVDDANHVVPQNFAVGVPTHFQNDGSVLYLLTPAVSPPTLEFVCQWVLEVLKRNNLNNVAGDSCDEVSPKPNATHFSRPDSSRQDNIKPHKNIDCTSYIGIVSVGQHTVNKHMKENMLGDNWNDLSQISCPDPEEKSHPTPLSQIGFHDPASVSCGQQLTLISIEVQADSRGDLRSDPKVDAINILSFAIQEDASHTLDVYVLMRGNESCGRNVDGVSEYKIVIFNDEKLLLGHFVKIISSADPDILMGWEIQGGSLGFVAERAAHLGISLLKKISRTPAYEMKHEAGSFESELGNINHETLVADTSVGESIIEDEWGRTHASGIHVTGRIVLNIWRLMRSELRLHFYSIEAVAKEVLRQKTPSISCRVLNQWFSSGPGQARYRCIEYVTERVKLNLQIMNKLDMINRTSELARVFGIDFFSVLSRGSQFRVESMLLRLAHTQNYLAISPGNQQVASQPAMECLPLVMEPESGFYVDPVVVLDFQSLYPSMIIAYNLCFSTCMGTVVTSKANVLGVSSYIPDPMILKDLKELFITPNGIMYVPPKVRRGVLPRLLEEILSTRIMLKQAIKKLTPSQKVLERILNARQLALKLIANVTYGYTAAGFSGRMPCAELADSIVQCGRRTLESAISFVNKHDKWKARVIYGDTDSMFVLLKGRSREEAFRIGNEIASAITALNPQPITLRMEKVYHPCFLLTKKRYVGYSFESADQDKPTFDAKGIETVRRDTCPAVAKSLERSIRLFFEHQDISVVKTYLQRQWKRILSGKISLQDFVFAKEVRLGTYSARASTLPPAAIVATKAMRMDPRAEPQYGERVPYVVIHGEPGARLVDMVVDPFVLLDISSPYRLNELYYITKQIIPALQRVFGLVQADVKLWFAELPRPMRSTLAKCHSHVSHSGSSNDRDEDIMPESSKRELMKRSRIDTYYISKYCTLCGDLAQTSNYLCDRCSKKDSFVAAALIGKASKLEREIQHMAAICRHCGGGDWVIESGVKCTSLACSVFYERRKVQKELQSFTSLTRVAGFYPNCVAEWF